MEPRLIKKKSIINGEEYLACAHKWKVILAEEGQRETLMTYFGIRSGDVMIYHMQCEKCGTITQRVMEVCHRGYPFKVLKEMKW